MSKQRGLPLPGLLDDTRLSGVAPIRRELAPRNSALLVDGTDISDARDAIGSACQSWGGGGFPILPLDNATHVATDLSPFWERLMSSLDPDWLDHRGFGALSLPSGVGGLVSHQGVAQPLLSVAHAQQRPPEDWNVVQIADLPSSTPWRTSYLACLGWLPSTPSLELLRAARFREDLRFEDLINVKHIDVETPGIADMMDRLQLTDHINPVQLSLMLLDRFPIETSTPLYEVASVLPGKNQKARYYGRALIVIYEPGNVHDLCFLWNLRAAYGHPPDLPIGLPAGDGLIGLLTEYQQGTPGHRPAGGRFALTSLSISPAELNEMTGNRFAVLPAGDVIRRWKRPARLSTDVGTFEHGRAQVAAWAQADRERLGQQITPHFGGGLVAHLEIQPQPLPNMPTRRWPYSAPFGEGFRHGGWEEPANEDTELLSMQWPSGWKVLEWTVEQHGLKVRPSRPGRAAVALLKRIGSIGGFHALLTPEIVERLGQLSERKGISWFRERYRGLAKEIYTGGDEAEYIGRLEAGLQSLNVRARDDDANELSGSAQLPPITDAAVKRRWLEWAEDAGLLMRGVRLACDICGDRYWRPLAEAIPPVACRGCGEAIPRPFPADQLQFRYRASEALAQAVSFDAMTHLLAMRWFYEFFRASHGEPSELYGMYPGVELVRDGEVLVEVDLLLLMADGSLIPGECKRTAAGLSADAVAKLEICRQSLQGPWSFLATADRASVCGEPWESAQRRLPDAPRFVLTAEHLFDPVVFQALGSDPFAWRADSEQDWQARAAAFAGRLPDLLAHFSGRMDSQDQFEPFS